MTDLFPRLLPLERETLPSFLSRLAASKGVKVSDLALDMGYSFKRLLKDDREARERLMSWSRLTEPELRELQSWTGVPAGNVTTRFRGELFGSRALRSPTIRGCPLCLREDAAANMDEPLQAMAMRGHWHLSDVTLCLIHQHVLVPLWEENVLTRRMDIQDQLERVLDQLINGALIHQDVVPTAFDLWLDHRLATGEDETWLASHSIDTAATFCRLLGGELLRPIGTSHRKAQIDLRAAQTAGFAIASQGEATIRASLDEMARKANQAGLEAATAFGWLYVKLSHDLRDQPEFDPIRDILREVILSVWPVAAGEVLLGKTIEKRLLHSIRTASLETGIREMALEVFLNEAEAFAPDDDRPRSRKTFPAEAFAALLSETAALVTAVGLADAMGASRSEVDALIRAKILSPRTSNTTIRLKWRIGDGLALNAELQALSVPVDASDSAWERLQEASIRTRLSIGELVQAIRTKEIQIGRIGAVGGFRAFAVETAALDHWRKARRARQLEAEPDLSDTQSSAEFARSIGLRDKDQFSAFIKAGHAGAFRMTHPVTRREQFRMTAQQIAAFHEKYLTPTTMMRESGLHRNTILARLSAAGIQPFAPDGQSFGAIYLRGEADPVIKGAAPR